MYFDSRSIVLASSIVVYCDVSRHAELSHTALFRELSELDAGGPSLPVPVTWFWVLFQVLADQEKFQEADELFRQAIEVDPERATVYVHRGQWCDCLQTAAAASVLDKCCFYSRGLVLDLLAYAFMIHYNFCTLFMPSHRAVRI